MWHRESVVVLIIGLLAGLVLAATARPASAQSEAKAAAEAAFQRAKELRDAGRMAEACAAFARSQELDPQRGTQYNLALCYQATGRLASAWGELTEVAAKDTNVRRREDAARRVAALAPRLTRMHIKVPSQLDGLTVHRGDQDITGLVGIDTPVDPGVYTIVVAAPGHARWQIDVDLTVEGATIAIDVPPLIPVAEPSGALGAGDVPTASPRPASRRGRVVAGLSLIGAGAVAGGVGAVFGFQYLGLRDDARQACGGEVDPCNGDLSAAQRYTDDARGVGRRASILLAAGAVAVGAGTVLWLTGRRPGRAERRSALVPTLGGDHAGVTLHGRF